MIVNVDNKRCTGCKRCYDICPLDVYEWDKEANRPVVAYDEECQMCFVCQEDCPVEAIHIRIPIAFW